MASLLVIPLLLAGILNIAPVPRALPEAILAARTARREQNVVALADHLAYIAEWLPWQPGRWEQAGRAAAQAGRWKDAAVAFERAIQAGGISTEGLFTLGEAYRQLGDLSRAGLTWESLAATAHPPERTFSALVGLREEQGDLVGAESALLAWREREPGNAEIVYRLALIQAAGGREDEARERIKELMLLDGHYAAKAEELQKTLRDMPKTASAARRMTLTGKAFASLGEWRLAALVLSRAVAKDPEDAVAWALSGEARQQLGLGGKEELDRALKLGPDNLLVQAIVAVYWRRVGNPERALSYLYRAAEIEPENAFWQAEIGETLAQMGDLDRALEHFQRAVDMEPGHLQYWVRLAQFSVHYEVSLRATGLPAIRRALSMDPASAQILDLYGNALFKLADPVGAERFLQRSLERDPSNPEAHLHLAQLFLENGENARAAAHLQRATELAGPDDTAGALARRLLVRYFGGG